MPLPLPLPLLLPCLTRESVALQYGHIGFSAAVDLIAAELADDVLSQKVDADDTGAKTMTRRDAWTRLLVNSRDYLQWNRGHAPNQDLADVLAAQVADSALGKIGASASRLPKADMLRAAKQAVGILAQPADDGRYKPPPGTGPVHKTTPGFWFSSQGISMEPNTNVNGGYSHGYGMTCNSVQPSSINECHHSNHCIVGFSGHDLENQSSGGDDESARCNHQAMKSGR